MNHTVRIISPVNDEIIAERELAMTQDIDAALQHAVAAQSQWRTLDMATRADFCHRAVTALLENSDEIARDITLQMGRPIQYSPGELKGVAERANYMIGIAEQELADIEIETNSGFRRYIRQQPRGVVFSIVPWNYPYLTAINSIIPALMAGNSVIIKHSVQTLLCAEQLHNAFVQAGLPAGVFQYLHLDHTNTIKLLQDKRINYISFTGSVSAGRAIEQTLAGMFTPLMLELGGKDPALVLADADLAHAVPNLVEGAFFNSGQSCCAIERIYVENTIYQDFVEAYIEEVKQLKLGNPLDAATSLGPVINSKAVATITEQIRQAIAMGAKPCIDASAYHCAEFGSSYMAPQVLLNVNHDMAFMREETFGPAVGIMPVSDLEQAVMLMNDSHYGLSASLWGKDIERASMLADKINTGTVFMNRCDYLDPALAWTGIKDSGRGCSLSALGYKQLTQPKSYHFRIV